MRVTCAILRLHSLVMVGGRSHLPLASARTTGRSMAARKTVLPWPSTPPAWFTSSGRRCCKGRSAARCSTQRRATAGRRSRETHHRDASGPAPRRAEATPAVSTHEDLDAEARARAEDPRRVIGFGDAVPVPVGGWEIERWVPVDDEELGVTRRQFFNRSLLAGLGLGGAVSAWPRSASCGP